MPKHLRVKKEFNTQTLTVERDITCWMDIMWMREEGNMLWSSMDDGIMGVPNVFPTIGITYVFRARVFLRDSQKL